LLKQKLERFGSGENQSIKDLKKRASFAFKESNLESALSVLREKTQDLVTLIDVSEPRKASTGTPSNTFLTRKELDRFSRINETAENLYQALGRACTKHTDHQAHLSLEAVHSNAAQIRFTIAFSRLSLANTSGQSEKSAWLTVESNISGRLESTAEQGSLVNTQASLKRVFDDEDNKKRERNKCKPAKRAVRFQVPPSLTPIQLSPVVVSAALPPPLENICTGSNFCDRLQRFMATTIPSNQAVGFLWLSGESKHLIYVDSKAQLVMQGQSSAPLTSLTNAFKDQQKDDPAGFSVAYRMGLARQLATAVLQFQSTPWLKDSWGCQKVLIARREPEEEEERDSQAFISAQIDGPNGPLSRAQSFPSVMVVRNRLLFSLGVMLLELAFQRPLSEMTKDSDKQSVDAGNAEYLTADRLSKRVSSHMGPRYAEVVKKCVHCYFASGNDLSQSKLQSEFFQDVVCELQKLERRAKGL